jgi:hypothetical protein
MEERGEQWVLAISLFGQQVQQAAAAAGAYSFKEWTAQLNI